MRTEAARENLRENRAINGGEPVNEVLPSNGGLLRKPPIRSAKTRALSIERGGASRENFFPDDVA